MPLNSDGSFSDIITGIGDPRLAELLAACCCRGGSGSGSGTPCRRDECCFCCVYPDGHSDDLSPPTLNAILECSCIPETPINFVMNRIERGCASGVVPDNFNYFFDSGISVDGSCTSCITGLGVSWADAGYLTCNYYCIAREVFTIGQFTAVKLVYFSPTTNFTLNLHPATDLHIISCVPFLAIASGNLVCETSTTGFYPSYTICNNCVGASYRLTLFE